MWFTRSLVTWLRILPNRSDRATSYALQELQPTKTVDDPEIKAWSALGTKSKKKGGGKNKKGKKGDIAETEAEPMDEAPSSATTQE
ncbi:ERBB-3 BINDING PROTEIN 1 [Salvia divinorum]